MNYYRRLLTKNLDTIEVKTSEQVCSIFTVEFPYYSILPHTSIANMLCNHQSKYILYLILQKMCLVLLIVQYFLIAPFISYIVSSTWLRIKRNIIKIGSASIKKPSELNLDTSGCRIHLNVPPSGKSPRNAFIALLPTFLLTPLLILSLAHNL